VAIDGRSATYLPYIVNNSREALAPPGQVLYLRDDSPQNEPRYRAGFSFDPNGIQMKGGEGHRLLTAQNGSGDVMYLALQRSNSNDYQVQAGVWTDGGSLVTTAWYLILDGPHWLEVDWQAASGAGKNDGHLTMWHDGTLKQSLNGLDNDTLRVEGVALGPLTGTSSSTVGTEYYDTFVSHRINPIGP